MTILDGSTAGASRRGASDAQPNRRGFRADINGLRAISVLAVIVFHTDPRLAPGGFAGVDVFFVISGFLITGIVAGRQRAGDFGYWAFVGERARRIVPALVAMCAGVLLLGLVILDPWTFERLAGAVPAALLFVSNIVYAMRTGYFSPAAANDWMTHTWSLSVEWQFYLVYPLLLAGLGRVTLWRRRPDAVLAALAFVVFTLGAAAPERWRSWEFYLAPCRSWEFLAGGACAFAVPGLRLSVLQRQVLHVVGLAMIGAAVGLLSADTSWPSPASALPVAGAVLVLLAAVESPAWARADLVRRIGLSSYSAYLWHWPIVLALRYWGVAFTPLVVILGVAASLLVGLAAYELVEQRATRAFLRRPRRWRAALGAIAVLGVAGAGWSAAEAGGFERLRTAGFPADVKRALADDRTAAADWSFPGDCDRIVHTPGRLSLCQIGGAAPGVLVIGDSRAEELAARYAGEPAGGAPGVAFLTREGCPPLPGVGLDRSMRCPEWSAAAFRFAASSPYARIVIVAAWPAYVLPSDPERTQKPCFVRAGRCATIADGEEHRRAVALAFARLEDVVRDLRARGKSVGLVGPSPRSPAADPMRAYASEFWSRAPEPPPLPRAEVEADAASSRAALLAIARATGAAYVDPVSALCGGGACPTSADGRALYKDAGHFRASQMKGPAFSYLDAWLRPRSSAAPGRLPGRASGQVG